MYSTADSFGKINRKYKILTIYFFEFFLIEFSRDLLGKIDTTKAQQLKNIFYYCMGFSFFLRIIRW